MSTDILSKAQQVPLIIKEPGRMTTACLLKHVLAGLHAIGKTQQEIPLQAKRFQILNLQPIWIINLEGVDRRLATDPATGCGIEFRSIELVLTITVG